MIFDTFEDLTQHAGRFGKDPRTLRRWMAEPDGLPYTMIGRKALFKPAWTIAWLESKRQQRNPAPAGRAKRRGTSKRHLDTSRAAAA